MQGDAAAHQLAQYVIFAFLTIVLLWPVIQGILPGRRPRKSLSERIAESIKKTIMAPINAAIKDLKGFLIWEAAPALFTTVYFALQSDEEIKLLLLVIAFLGMLLIFGWIHDFTKKLFK